MAREKAERNIVSFRVSSEDYQVLERAAADAGETLSEFVRRSALIQANYGWPVRSLANTSYTAPFAQTVVSPAQVSSTPSHSSVQEDLVRQR